MSLIRVEKLVVGPGRGPLRYEPALINTEDISAVVPIPTADGPHCEVNFRSDHRRSIRVRGGVEQFLPPPLPREVRK